MGSIPIGRGVMREVGKERMGGEAWEKTGMGGEIYDWNGNN